MNEPDSVLAAEVLTAEVDTSAADEAANPVPIETTEPASADAVETIESDDLASVEPIDETIDAISESEPTPGAPVIAPDALAFQGAAHMFAVSAGILAKQAASEPDAATKGILERASSDAQVLANSLGDARRHLAAFPHKFDGAVGEFVEHLREML